MHFSQLTEMSDIRLWTDKMLAVPLDYSTSSHWRNGSDQPSFDFDSSLQTCVINPLAPEFKIPAEPINAGDKWWHPGDEQYRCVLRFIVLSYSRNSLSKDIMFVRDPGGFLVALSRVNALEAAMKAVRSVEEDGREVSICLRCEAEG